MTKEHEVVENKSHVCITCAQVLVPKSELDHARSALISELEVAIEGMKKEYRCCGACEDFNNEIDVLDAVLSLLNSYKS